jgi:hypothetical protein
MQDRNTGSTPQVDAIDRVLERAYAMRLPVRWMAWTGAPWIAITIATPVLHLLAEAFLGQKLDLAVAYLYELPLMLPFLSMGCWWAVEQGRFRKAFPELRNVFVPGQSDARQIAPPSAIGPLLEVTLAEAGVIGIWDEKELTSVTALLDALLRSLRLEDAVALTADQRKRLHEIVMPGRREDWYLGVGGVGGKKTVVYQRVCDRLRPAAIKALGLLGDASSIRPLERFANKTRSPEMRTSALHSVTQIRERSEHGPEQSLQAGKSPELSSLLPPTTPPDESQNHV